MRREGRPQRSLQMPVICIGPVCVPTNLVVPFAIGVAHRYGYLQVPHFHCVCKIHVLLCYTLLLCPTTLSAAVSADGVVHLQVLAQTSALVDMVHRQVPVSQSRPPSTLLKTCPYT